MYTLCYCVVCGLCQDPYLLYDDIWCSNLFVDPDDGDRINGGKQDGGEADAAALAVDVQHVGVALRLCQVDV